MKPVKKGPAPLTFTSHGQAKPYLIQKLGEHCSYCERHNDPQGLDVEHIYPKDPHPKLELAWGNFLLSCKSCNSFKNSHLGSSPQKRLTRRFLWPHRDNTFNAFDYLPDGRVEVLPGLPPSVEDAAKATREMVGLLASPATAATYKKLGLAYDGVTKRNQLWNLAEGLRSLYLENPVQSSSETVAKSASAMGYFSVWMRVFHDRREVRRELIKAFQADPDCFDADTNPRFKGRL